MLHRLIALTACLAAAAVSANASAIADAAMKRDSSAVQALIRQKADVNAPQADGTAALHWAVRWDDAAMAAELIRAGAKPEIRNRLGATPMFLAALNGSARLIEILLDAGADPNAPVLSRGETALMMAARTGNDDAVRLLLDRGAKVDAAEDLRGTNALMWAAEEGQVPVIRLLIQHGAAIDAPSRIVTPVRRNGLGFARPDATGKPAVETIGGLTALLFAVREGHAEAVKILADAGADVNKTSTDGSTPLLVAVQNGHYGVARFLIDRGANINQANTKGWMPLYLAVANRNALTTAVPAPPPDGALDFINLLLERGADPNARIRTETEVRQANTSLWLRESGSTPLLRAALCGDLTVVRLLLGYGADPLIGSFDNTTPLMAASGVGWAEGFTFERSENETYELVKLLLDLGASVTGANEDGITALHGAAYKGANRVVQLLVERGADLAAKDKGKDYGFGVSTVRMTPLNWAEGVPIGMSSAIYRTETVALLSRLMQERGIPVVSNVFRAQKPPDPPAR